MKYSNLGSTGIKVSNLCLGMMSFGNSQKWHLEIEDAKPIVDYALDNGINFFDTANVYSNGRSEEITGELLQDHRDDVVIATKVRFEMNNGINDKGLSRYHIKREIKNSLDRLKMDFIDLYQIHRLDYSLDMEILMRNMNHLIDEGSALHIGASSMFGWELVKAQSIAEKYGLEKFSTMQNHYNAIYREEEREVIPACMDMKMGIIPWSPLARGFLSGKYSGKKSTESRFKSDPYLKKRYFHENDFEVLGIIKECAKENDISVAQMSLKWVLSQKGITSPIIGITKLNQLKEAIEVSEMNIDKEYINRISAAYSVRPIIGHSYNQPDQMINEA
jgi:aryl-alcohol dehydrogenase-like predicted oxidoreductase